MVTRYGNKVMGVKPFENHSPAGSVARRYAMRAVLCLLVTLSISFISLTEACAQTVTVTSPNGGEVWNVGSVKRVQWSPTPSGTFTAFSWQISRDGGSTWTTLESGLPGNYTYRDWTVTGPGSSSCRVKVIGNYSGGSTSDTSNSNFTIGQLTITSPNGGENWQAGTTQTITWTSSGVTGNIQIEPYLGGIAQPNITTSAPNTGSYSWTIPPTYTPGTTYQMSISALSGNVWDFSNANFTISAPPTVTVSAPNGGEVWGVGATKTIQWSATGSFNSFSISVSRDSGATWSESIATGLSGSARSYVWRVTAPGSTSCRIMVVGNYTGGSASDTSDSNFTIGQITITAPNGGETWQAGTRQYITWTSGAVSGNVQIEPYTGCTSGTDCSGGTALAPITTSNTGSYAWDIPVGYTPGSTYQMSISAMSGNVWDFSNANFTISAPPTVAVSAPNGGEVWGVGATKKIQWASAGTFNSFSIYLSRDGGATYSEQIAVGLPGNYYYWDWSVTGPGSTNCLIMVTGNYTGGSVSDTSNGNFTIGQLTITSPNGGENWPVGSMQTITWTSSAVSGNIQIEPYLGGVAQANITASAPNTGSYSWTIPSNYTVGTTYQMSISALNGNVWDFSDANFTISPCTVPNPPSLTSPSSGNTVAAGSVLFSWGASVAANRYRLKITTDAAMSQHIAGSPFEPAVGVQQQTVTLAAGTYYWQVQAISSNESCGWGIYGPSPPWVVPVQSPGQPPTLTPLYRLYNNSVKDHLYTTSALERDSAASRAVPYKFNYERIEGFVSSSSCAGSVPLYRYYNATKDMHYLTTNASDSTVAAGGFALENTYYIYPNQAEWTTPLYHSEHVANTDHFYTTSKYEYQHSVNTWGFTDRGIVGYVTTRVANNRPQGNVAGVGMAVGNFAPPSFTDISLRGVGPQLSFTRYYDSFAPGATLGQGWSFNYDSWVLEDASGGIHVEWGNGSESHFDSSRVPYPGYFEKAGKVNDGMNYGYDITTKDQTVYQFRRFSLGTPGPNILLITVTDRYGNRLALNREANYGVVMSAADATGRYLAYDYLPVSLADGRTLQRLTKVTDTSITPNRVINLTYNDKGNLNSVTDARGNVTSYSYNADGFLAGITYPEGNSVNVTYSVLGQVTGYTNGSIALSFDYQGGTAGTIVKTGATPLINYVPDTQYRADNIKFPDGTNIKPTYLTGNLVNLEDNVKDRNGNVSYFTYDANGNLLTVKNALNETTTYTYDVWNNLTSIADPRNTNPATSDAYKTKFTYDATGKCLQGVRKPLGGTTNYTYYSNGLVSNVTDPTSHSVSINYDTNGNVTKINDDALATSMDYTNDNAGSRLTQTDLLRPTPQLTTWSYDNNDNVTSVQVATNPAAIFRYDGNNRLYNVVDQRSKTTVYTYNGMNLLKSMKSPDLKTWQYAYDSVGKLSTVTLPDGNSVTYAYDASRRLQYVRYNGAEKLYYTYDNDGNVLSLRVDSSRTTSFLYDAANRVTSVTDPFNNVIGYGYDPAGNRTSITYPGSNVVTYTFDADNRLATVKDWLGTAVTTYNYNSAGILQSISNANGTTTSFTYDAANRLTALANRRSNGSTIADYSLVLDKMGNPTSITRDEPLAPSSLTAADTVYSYGDANQIQSAGSVNYTHDGLGNLNGASNGRSFVYDYANQLMNASVGGDTFSYLYDGFGNRISRTKNGVQTKYLLDLNADISNVLAETDASGAVQNYYIHGLGLLSRINSSGQRYTYHYDQLGNTVAVTDDSNNVVESYTYDEFGQVLASTGAGANPFRYVGKYGVMDEGNGLLHMRARYYDTETGRFLSRDPQGFNGGDFNLYSYVKGNPLMAIDPKGTWWSPLGAFASAIVESPFLFCDFVEASYHAYEVVGSLYTGDYSHLNEESSLLAESNAKVMSHYENILIGSIGPAEGSTTATQVFGKTGALQLLDMRTRQGLVTKVVWRMGEEKLKDMAKDEVKRRLEKLMEQHQQ
jgi:RHS repeat-associated protein